MERKKTADEIQRFIGNKGPHPWIRVDKERSRIRYRMNENDISSLTPTKEESNATCSIEIVQLKLKKNKKKKNVSWWSLGFDLFSGNKVSKDEWNKMKEIARVFA